MNERIKGGCCCGKVKFSVVDDFSLFYFCHCSQCRKLTGSAHASNLFTQIDNLVWEAGESFLKRYDDPERSFSKVFCSECGSGLPFVTQSGKFLIVPAGSLDQEPSINPQSQIFCSEQTLWHKEGVKAKKVEGFPE